MCKSIIPELNEDETLKKFLKKCEDRKFNLAKFLLAGLNKLKINNKCVNFYGNEEVYFITHFKAIFTSTLLTQCSSPSCPQPQKKIILNDVTSLPMPLTNIDQQLIQQELQIWFTSKSQLVTNIDQQLIQQELQIWFTSKSQLLTNIDQQLIQQELQI